ncbi:hypothetical protein SprV_0401581500 [Sparganum proliferum]
MTSLTPSPSITVILATIPATTVTTTAPILVTSEYTPDNPSTTALTTTTPTFSDVYSVPTCAHCGRTFTSRIGLLVCMRIHDSVICRDIETPISPSTPENSSVFSTVNSPSNNTATTGSITTTTDSSATCEI